MVNTIGDLIRSCTLCYIITNFMHTIIQIFELMNCIKNEQLAALNEIVTHNTYGVTSF